MSIRLGHEILNAEIMHDPPLHVSLREAVLDRTLPRSYFEHPFVQTAADGQWPFPLALYFDAMPYIKRDGVLAVVLVNILSGARHLLAVLRKSTLCRCGCAGWCSVWPILANLHWTLAALREGRYPSAGPPGMVWDEDSDRALLGGIY